MQHNKRKKPNTTQRKSNTRTHTKQTTGNRNGIGVPPDAYFGCVLGGGYLCAHGLVVGGGSYRAWCRCRSDAPHRARCRGRSGRCRCSHDGGRCRSPSAQSMRRRCRSALGRRCCWPPLRPLPPVRRWRRRRRRRTRCCSSSGCARASGRCARPRRTGDCASRCWCSGVRRLWLELEGKK